MRESKCVSICSQRLRETTLVGRICARAARIGLEAGAAERVTPLRAEAHALPFASGFFDAVISIDAYHYFGTDQLYLGYLASFVRPGGRIGVALPSLLEELDEPPAHLLEPQANGKVFWESELWSLQSPCHSKLPQGLRSWTSLCPSLVSFAASNV
mgnify:CR=1 FL=1